MGPTLYFLFVSLSNRMKSGDNIMLVLFFRLVHLLSGHGSHIHRHLSACAADQLLLHNASKGEDVQGTSQIQLRAHFCHWYVLLTLIYGEHGAVIKHLQRTNLQYPSSLGLHDLSFIVSPSIYKVKPFKYKRTCCSLFKRAQFQPLLSIFWDCLTTI